MTRDSFVRSDRIEIPLLTEPYCTICSLPISEGYTYCVFCNPTTCAYKRPYIKVRSVEYYRDDDFNHQLSNDIRSFKKDKSLASLLGECLVHVLTTRYSSDLLPADIIVPILQVDKTRGYNQAALLAKYISIALGITYLDCLYARESFSPLRGKDQIEREQIIFDKIGCNSEVKGKRILLTDDVYASGATMRECGWTLNQAGAASVKGIVVGKSVDRTHLRYIGRIK